MKKSYQVIVSIFCAALLLMSLSACSCRHERTDATCTEPKVCSKCGETEGDALGHSWGSWKVEKRQLRLKVVQKNKLVRGAERHRLHPMQLKVWLRTDIFC